MNIIKNYEIGNIFTNVSYFAKQIRVGGGLQFKMYPVFVLIRYGKTSDTEMIVMNKEYKLIDPWKHEACCSTQGHTGK